MVEVRTRVTEPRTGERAKRGDETLMTCSHSSVAGGEGASSGVLVVGSGRVVCGWRWMAVVGYGWWWWWVVSDSGRVK